MAVTQRVDQFVFEFGILTRTPQLVDQFVVEFAILPLPPVISCGNPPDATFGSPYSHTFPVSGGLAPFTFTVAVPAIPTGLTLNATTGVLSGTPTVPGHYTFTLQVTDSNLQSSQVACSINVIPAGAIKITIRGVKRVRICDDAKEGSFMEASVPHVTRAV